MHKDPLRVSGLFQSGLLPCPALCCGALALVGTIALKSNCIRVAHAQPIALQTSNTELLVACGQSDPELTLLATHLAAIKLGAMTTPSVEAVASELRRRGYTHPWPHWLIWIGAPVNRTAARTRVQAWSKEIATSTKCGAASLQDQLGHEVVAIVATPAMADLIGLPRSVRVGGWVTVRTAISTSLDKNSMRTARIVIFGPHRPPRSLFTSLHEGEGRLTARFSADFPGEWRVQLVAETSGNNGPRPLAEASLWAGSTAPAEGPFKQGHNPIQDSEKAPGEEKEEETPTATLLAMLNAARTSLGLLPLTSQARLSQLAEAHSRRMAERATLTHNAGDQDPPARVAEGGIAARQVGENTAHAASLALAHRALWESPSHRQNMLSAQYKEAGVGVVKGRDGTVWVTEIFIAPL